MKLVHTADWHLGKIVSGFSMLPDQAHFLSELCALLQEERPDALIVAGDIYDRPIPSGEAVKLLNDTLSEIVLNLRIPVLMIAGNHDSGDRLDFGSRFLEQAGLYIVGTPQRDPVSVTLHDAYGPVRFFLLPYLDPPTVRSLYPEEKITGWQQAFDRAAAPILAQADGAMRNVLVCHGFFCCTKEEATLAAETDLGGADLVDLHVFSSFDYVAAGHVHRAGNFSARMRQSGSILKYSVREAEHRPCVSVVTLGQKGDVSVETREIPPLRDLRVITDSFDRLMAANGSDDYLFLQLTDKELILNAAARLRERYPNLMGVSYRPLTQSLEEQPTLPQKAEKSITEQFDGFYELLMGEAMNESQRALIEQAERTLRKEADA